MKISVRVPATTANLGPGFDCLGLALQVWNTITITESPGGAELHWRKHTRSSPHDLPPGATNLVLHAMNEFFQRVQLPLPRVRVTTTNCIPIGRGLGSSAAAIVGGLVAANAWAGNKLTTQQLLELATEIEGHPDNVSAALLGGLTIAIREDANVFAVNVRPPRGWRAVVFIPAQELSTQFARTVLPQRITREDAIYNIGRVALLIRAFAQGDASSLDLATGDRLHEPYRAPLVPGMDEFSQSARDAGAHGVALSGAGPSMIAFAANSETASRVARAFEQCARSLQLGGEVRVVGLSARGAYIRRT